MSFGLYFKELRKSKGFTQEELAKAIGKTKMLISGVETGRNSSFTDEDTDKIIKALNLSVEEGIEFKIQASQARGRLPLSLTDYLFVHDDLLALLDKMADQHFDGNRLKAMINYVEEILDVQDN